MGLDIYPVKQWKVLVVIIVLIRERVSTMLPKMTSNSRSSLFNFLNSWNYKETSLLLILRQIIFLMPLKKWAVLLLYNGTQEYSSFHQPPFLPACSSDSKGQGCGPKNGVCLKIGGSGRACPACVRHWVQSPAPCIKTKYKKWGNTQFQLMEFCNLFWSLSFFSWKGYIDALVLSELNFLDFHFRTAFF